MKIHNKLLTPQDIKKSRYPLAMTTAYDQCFARLAEAANIDLILVGDSAANVLFGFKSTKEVHRDIIALLVHAVSKGAPNTHIVADMPYSSVQDPQIALKDAQFFLEKGAHSVKVEGVPKLILKTLIQNKIPIMGHLGLLPQTSKSLKQVGINKKDHDNILAQAKYLESIGAFSIVLEHLNSTLAQKVTKALSIPTIGIGAGPYVSGQVLVSYDLLGITKEPVPPFVKRFSQVGDYITQGFQKYIKDVREKKFP